MNVVYGLIYFCWEQTVLFVAQLFMFKCTI